MTYKNRAYDGLKQILEELYKTGFKTLETQTGKVMHLLLAIFLLWVYV